MESGRDFLHAKQLAERALSAMIEQRVPPTPRNYSVWYAHHTGHVGELSTTIRQMIQHGQEFTPERNDDLYSRFVAQDTHLDSMQHASDHLHSTLSRMMSYLEAAAGDTRAYNARLDQYSEQLEGKPTLDGLKAIVSDLAAETQRVVQQSRRLEDQLVQSSGEITQLRENLATVQREAMTDALTGIPNRSYFERRLRELTEEATRAAHPLSLLFIDIDHFKKFNDTYGHQLGDQVLRLVAKTLTDCVKGRDVAARYGGEEFAILLPHTSLRDAAALAEQIRATLVRRRIVRKNSGDQLGVVTVSVGVSAWRPGETSADFISRADGALYHAKGHGRNRVASEEDFVSEMVGRVAIPA
jgi:diguanylate cyclase